MATVIVTVTAFTITTPFNVSASRVRNLNVNQLLEVDNITVAGNPGINGVIISPRGKIYTNQTGDAIKALANA